MSYKYSMFFILFCEIIDMKSQINNKAFKWLTWDLFGRYAFLVSQPAHFILYFYFYMFIPLQELRKQCQDFATALLDHTRSSYELEVLLNHDPTGPAFEHGERMHLNRLKLAIKFRQKKVPKKFRLDFFLKYGVYVK